MCLSHINSMYQSCLQCQIINATLTHNMYTPCYSETYARLLQRRAARTCERKCLPNSCAGISFVLQPHHTRICAIHNKCHAPQLLIIIPPQKALVQMLQYRQGSPLSTCNMSRTVRCPRFNLPQTRFVPRLACLGLGIQLVLGHRKAHDPWTTEPRLRHSSTQRLTVASEGHLEGGSEGPLLPAAQRQLSRRALGIRRPWPASLQRARRLRRSHYTLMCAPTCIAISEAHNCHPIPIVQRPLSPTAAGIEPVLATVEVMLNWVVRVCTHKPQRSHGTHA